MLVMLNERGVNKWGETGIGHAMCLTSPGAFLSSGLRAIRIVNRPPQMKDATEVGAMLTRLIKAEDVSEMWLIV